MLSHLDVLPLCLAVSGAAAVPGRVLDGRNPLATLAGTAKSPHERLAFAYDKCSALREGSLKIVRPASDRPWELYDLSSDLVESKNLASTRPADVARLDAAYQSWLVDVKRDASPPAPRPGRPKKQGPKLD
jgi:arylsulfatase A-like enzyme